MHDPYARLTPHGGAVYLLILNHADDDDRLISASSPQADMAMVMVTTEKNGVTSMTNTDGGLVIRAYDTVVLAPGQAHVMLMGLKARIQTGATIEVTLTFANSGKVTLRVPVMNTRSAPPADVKTGFDAETHNHVQTELATETSALSMALSEDQLAIAALLKGQFEKPDAPLAVDPVVVMGEDAIASWAQGPMAGRALLRRTDGQWAVVLCAGPDLRAEDFLARHGVKDAAMLSQMFNQAEDGLGADKVGLYSTFDGVVKMSKPASN